MTFINRLINAWQQPPVMGINARNVHLVGDHNPRQYFSLADHKVKTKIILAEHALNCAPTYAVVEGIGAIPNAWQSVQDQEAIAIKPAQGRCGGGILILKKNEAGQWCKGGQPITEQEVFQHLGNIVMGTFSTGDEDAALIEYCIEPHPFLHTFYPKGVPDFRIILLKGRPLIAMLRLPTKRSQGKANLHQGGIGVGIDMKTGRLKQGYDGQNYCDHYPDTGVRLTDTPIPLWEEMMALSLATAAVFPLQYLGIDLTLDRELGPLIMEVNARPGLAVQLVNRQNLHEALHNQNIQL